MGLLSLGTPLPWDKAKKHANHVRIHGINQFINMWNKTKTLRKDKLLWGDEIEYTVVNMNNEQHNARLSLHAAEVLDNLRKDEVTEENYNASWKPEYAKYMIEGTPFKPYGSTINDLLTVENNMNIRRKLIREKLSNDEVVTSMTTFPTLGCKESLYPWYKPTPCSGASHSLYIPDEAITSHARFPTLTENIRKRRGSKVAINLPIYRDVNTPKVFKEQCPEYLTEALCKHYIDTHSDDEDKEENSNLVKKSNCSLDKNNDNITSNEREEFEHMAKVFSNWYCDGYASTTSKNQASCSSASSTCSDTECNPLYLSDIVSAAKPDHVYLDCMCFGMGCSCLQITFQACCVEQARQLYDLLAPISPIMLALTAGAPATKGYLVDTDCRWDVISGSVDDRNEEERGLKPLKDSRFQIKKSRYASIDSYLSPGPQYSRNEQYNNNVYTGGSHVYYDENGLPKSYSNISHYKPKYNDIDFVYDKEFYEQLKENKVDDLLAKHIAHLFIRDPLVIFNELLDQDDTKSMDHFENIQSTNWQTLRFKPPPANSDIGWRVEFRSMEIQLTDFANSAFSIFIVLLTRTIMSFNLNFYIPLSKVDENMKTAQVRDAAKTKKFWFRKHVIPKDSMYKNYNPEIALKEEEEDDAYELMTMNEIFNGNADKQFPGIIPLVRSYLSSLRLDSSTYASLERYLFFISQRAKGELMTDAAWIRKFMVNHEDYKHDSKITNKMVYDLCQILEGVNKGDQDALLKIYDTVGIGIFGIKPIFSSDHINMINSTPFCDYYLMKTLPCIKCTYKLDNIEHSENCKHKNIDHFGSFQQKRTYNKGISNPSLNTELNIKSVNNLSSLKQLSKEKLALESVCLNDYCNINECGCSCSSSSEHSDDDELHPNSPLSSDELEKQTSTSPSSAFSNAIYSR